MTKRLVCWSVSLAVTTSALVSAGTTGYVPPRWSSGQMPTIPPRAVSAGEVWLDVLVTSEGRVASVDTLRSTPPFDAAMIAAVHGWRFEPATAAATTVAARVLVVGMFAPPALAGPTLGEPPRTLRAPGGDLPVPSSTSAAPYPPRATGDGAVLVEVTIDNSGTPADARIVVSSPAFDDAALTTAGSWSFEPARSDGRSVRAHAYLLFAFRQPVT